MSRIAEYKAIETTPQFFGLQQRRWPPTNIQNSPAAALAHLFMLPGSRYHVPELAWKYEMGPGGIGFVEGDGLVCRPVLSLPIPGHGLTAAHVHEAGARRLVKKMQRQRFHVRRYIEAKERMPRWM